MAENINLRMIPPKKAMPVIAIIVGCVLILFLAALTIEKGKTMIFGPENPYRNTIMVSGTGEIQAKPDIGQVDLTVLTDANTVVAAQKENTEKMEKITKAMKDLGIAENDLKTTNYNIAPKYEYVKGKSNIAGYEITQTLRVKIRDLAKTSDILGKAAGLGANQVGSLTFTFDDDNNLKAEARTRAIEQARKNAENLAKSLGVKLGKLSSFNEVVGGEASKDMAVMYSSGMGGGGGAAPPVQTGQNELSVTVNLFYEIR